jgi:hypothetical protein
MIPFEFYWDRINIWAGIKFLIVMLVLYILSFWIEFPWYLVGTSVLLAWMVVLLGNPRNKILMVFLYLLAGLGITLMNNYFFDTYWPWLISIFIVTFFGTFLLKYGLQWYMLGWCSILWFYIMPIMGQMGNPKELVISHVIGSTAVLFLVTISVLWEWSRKNTEDEEVAEPEAAKPVPLYWITAYSTILAVVMVFGLMIGHKYLTDPTMISNAAFMIMVFTGNVLIWKAGLERMIGAIIGIVLGFYLGVLFQSELLGLGVMVVFYFLLLVFVVVNNGLVILFFLLTISYGWGLQDFETGNALANERILAELAGVILAGGAIFILNLIAKLFEPAKE